MAAPDPEDVNFVVRHLAEIVTGLTVALLATLKILGKRETATAAQEILQDRPVSHDEMENRILRHEIQMTDIMNRNFSEFRHELMDEIRALHGRINSK